MHIIIICLRERGKKKNRLITLSSVAPQQQECVSVCVRCCWDAGRWLYSYFWCLASASQQPGNTTIITKACSHKRHGKQQFNIHAIFLQFNIALLRTELTLIYPDEDSTSMNSKTHLINFSIFFFFAL